MSYDNTDLVYSIYTNSLTTRLMLSSDSLIFQAIKHRVGLTGLRSPWELGLEQPPALRGPWLKQMSFNCLLLQEFPNYNTSIFNKQF